MEHKSEYRDVALDAIVGMLILIMRSLHLG